VASAGQLPMPNELAFDRLGWNELLIIFLLLFVLFGHRLPPFMRDIGRLFIQGPRR
jgi:hypothetical protein